MRSKSGPVASWRQSVAVSIPRFVPTRVRLASGLMGYGIHDRIDHRDLDQTFADWDGVSERLKAMNRDKPLKKRFKVIETSTDEDRFRVIDQQDGSTVFTSRSRGSANDHKDVLNNRSKS